MKISSQHNSPLFKSRCPEIRLGQDVCHLVNTEFPHYSMTKFQPIIDKYIAKTQKPSAVMFLTNRLYNDRPCFPDVAFYPNYFLDLFNYIEKHHAFNCQESSLLSALILKLKGIKNVYTASIRNGWAEIDHVICFFNRDRSKYDGNIKNNQTIIVDPWADTCDFANNVFKEYENSWDKHFHISEIYKSKTDGKYEFDDVEEMHITKSEIRTILPNFRL